MKKWLTKNRKALIFVLVVFFLWQGLLWLVLNVGENLSPLIPNYVYVDPRYGKNPAFLWNRANFDGIHYIDIAKKGYGIYQQAFFPVYPNLIKWLTPYFSGRDLLTALSISWVSFLLALFFLYKLVKLDFKDEVARRTLLLLLFFPASFFFSTVYTESLFLFLVVSAFYFARTKKWLLAGLLGAMASGTRVIGVFLLPALLFEWYLQIKDENPNISSTFVLLKKNFINLLPILLVPLGLLTYMRYLSLNYNDPFMFIHVQSSFGAGRSGDNIVLLHQVFWRYIKMILTTQWDTLYFAVWLEFISAILFLSLLILAFIKKVRSSYLIFSGLAYIVPTLTGTFLSMQRFVLILFPCFIVYALLKKKVFRYVWWFLGGFLLIVSVLFFSRGYWVG